MEDGYDLTSDANTASFYAAASFLNNRTRVWALSVDSMSPVERNTYNLEYGVKNHNSWYNLTKEQREAYLPVKYAPYKEDKDGRPTGEKFIGKSSGKDVLTHFRLQMIKVGK